MQINSLKTDWRSFFNILNYLKSPVSRRFRELPHISCLRLNKKVPLTPSPAGNASTSDFICEFFSSIFLSNQATEQLSSELFSIFIFGFILAFSKELQKAPSATVRLRFFRHEINIFYSVSIVVGTGLSQLSFASHSSWNIIFVTTVTGERKQTGAKVLAEIWRICLLVGDFVVEAEAMILVGLKCKVSACGFQLRSSTLRELELAISRPSDPCSFKILLYWLCSSCREDEFILADKICML